MQECFILAGAITKAYLKKMFHQVSMKGDQDPKELGYRLIRIRSLFIEAGVAIDESDLIDQAMIALPGHDCVDVMTAAHRNAEMSGEHT